jgi:aspartyl-tRNA(Asn)/glutamyl-tRNA(Gln) amidotransferase subunit C
MAISKEDIEKIARLAHLPLTVEEEVKISEKLSSVLTYVNKLKEVDTEGIEPLAHVTGVQNVMREDEVKNCEADVRDAIISAFPDSENGQLKVRSVFK